MEERRSCMMRSLLVASLITTTLTSPVENKHRAAFDEIARVNQQYEKYQNGRQWQVDMKIPRRNIGEKGVAGLAPIRDRNSLWPQGVIPYTISYSIPETNKIRQILKKAMDEWEMNTCIRFEKRVNQSDYVEFYYGEGCNSDVGRVGGRQTTSLGRGCAHHGIVVHELGHLVGFWHEQNRPDRDNYIKINMENIVPRFKFAFDRYSSRKIDSLGVEYDYVSIMHYGFKAFSKNGKPTLVPRDPSVKKFGNSRLSPLDIKQANLLYKCPDYPELPGDFVWKNHGPMGENAWCLKIHHPKSRGWHNNYLCYRKDKKNLQLRWSINGPLNGKRCIHIAVPTKPSQEAWNQTYLCWPLDVHYKFKWLTHAPGEEEKNTCMKLTEPRDPTWNDSRYYLCGSKDQRPINGKWAQWKRWSSCSQRCGGGTQTRSRTCTNPQPSFGGSYCKGRSLDRRPCNSHECAEWPTFPDDFSFGLKERPNRDEVCVRIFERWDYFTWNNYLFCTPREKRQLDMRWMDVEPVKLMEDHDCTLLDVPADSRRSNKRGLWDNNYLCIPKDNGFPYRFVWSHRGRIPNLPCLRWFAKNGRDGWNMTYLCVTHKSSEKGKPKAINGGWSSWEPWNSCSKTCDGGKQHRIRTCDKPKPQYGGKPCVGKAIEGRICNTHICPTTCGGMLSGMNGSFTSPNFPKPYPTRVDCEWIIRTRLGQVINLHFEYFDVEGSTLCRYDYVSVHDGRTTSSRQIAKFCASVIPVSLQSSSNFMFVKFHSDTRRTYKGFLAKWQSTNVRVRTDPRHTTKCGGQITEPNGTLTSPGYPNNYGSNLDCIWVITAPMGHHIKLEFKRFDIDKVGLGCRYDYVEVRDGNSRDSPSLGRHCGTSAGQIFKTISNHARIRLYTDSSRERNGFVLGWMSVAAIKPDPTTKPVCPKGWVSHVIHGTDKVHCYLVRMNTNTWYMARNDCLKSDSDLLSITDANEQDFVAKHLLAESFMWIGYNDLEREGAWAWSDRTPIRYQNWATGDPNNGGSYRRKDEDCAVLKSNGKWNDYPCTTRFRYICKARASRLRLTPVNGLHNQGEG